MAAAFLVNDNVGPHAPHDKACPACTDDYPEPCPNCDGLMHGHFSHMRGDKQILDGRCDGCGRNLLGQG